MKKRFLYILIFLVSSLGCKEEKEVSVEKKVVPPNIPHLVNWEHFNDFGLQNVSFPIWFDSLLIEKNNIRRITVSFQDYKNVEENAFRDSLPVVLQVFNFKKGELVNMSIEEFSSEISIANHSFRYRKKKDSFGFSLPELTNKVIYEDNRMLPIFSTIKVAQVFERLKLLKVDSAVVEYQNTLSTNEDRHIFILDSAKWNVMFIDRRFKVKNNATFYYGRPKQVIEAFKVKNLVNKDKIIENTYYSNNVPDQQSFFSEGFEKKRTFQYDEKGICIGYVDSLISSPNDFIESHFSVIESEKDLPREVFTYESSDSLLKNPLERISFTYENQ